MKCIRKLKVLLATSALSVSCRQEKLSRHTNNHRTRTTSRRMCNQAFYALERLSRRRKISSGNSFSASSDEPLGFRKLLSFYSQNEANDNGVDERFINHTNIVV